MCVKVCLLDDAISGVQRRGPKERDRHVMYVPGVPSFENWHQGGRLVRERHLWATVIGLAQVNGMRYAVQFEAVLATRSQIWRPQRLGRILGRMGNMGHSGAERRMGISRADPGRASLVQRRPRTAACGTR